MDEKNIAHEPAYLDVLMWLETASIEQIRGAMAIAQGISRIDLENGIQALMQTDRPGLAAEFPQLVKEPVSIASLAKRYGCVATALEQIAESIRKRKSDPKLPVMGFGALSAALSQLQSAGKIRADQRRLLDDEIWTMRQSQDGFANYNV
ncbi:hypothetical protein ACPTKS_30790 [Pseudomonas aeruginosa]|uniref:hypothetical protein n=1 Tax=Pseudomonas aeruginosa TaxID=287 RepID=UPI003CC6C5D1